MVFCILYLVAFKKADIYQLNFKIISMSLEAILINAFYFK